MMWWSSANATDEAVEEEDTGAVLLVSWRLVLEEYKFRAYILYGAYLERKKCFPLETNWGIGKNFGIQDFLWIFCLQLFCWHLLPPFLQDGSVVKKKMNNDLNEFELYLVQMEGWYSSRFVDDFLLKKLHDYWEFKKITQQTLLLH